MISVKREGTAAYLWANETCFENSRQVHKPINSTEAVWRMDPSSNMRCFLRLLLIIPTATEVLVDVVMQIFTVDGEFSADQLYFKVGGADLVPVVPAGLVEAQSTILVSDHGFTS